MTAFSKNWKEGLDNVIQVALVFWVTNFIGVDVFIYDKRWNQQTRCPKVSWHVFVIQIFIPKNIEGGIFSQRIVEHSAISFKLYELDASISYVSAVLIQGMGVFTSSNASVGSGGLFLHMSLKLLVIVVIFTEHGSTISLSPWHCLYHKNRGTLFNHTWEEYIMTFFAIVLLIVLVKHNLFKHLNKELCM